MATYAFRLNGRGVSADSWDPAQPLLYVLRNAFNLHGAKFGCGLGQCGACTVILDGRAARACQTRIDRVAGRTVTTVEGLGTVARPDRLQEAFVAEQAAQCGYCTAGIIMSAKALLKATPRPTRDQVCEALAGNLCRCGSHDRVIRAVLRAAGTPGGR
jgi:nicotinate dehydrogenase subunit A